jgi:hypothetical protein
MFAPTIPVPATRSYRPHAVVGVVLALWFGAAFALATAGVFVTPAGQPPLAILAAVLLPVAVFAAAYLSSAGVRDYVRSGDPALLTAIQGWRILGGTFLVLFAFGMLPAAFAMPAGWGDVAIGVTAPFVARLAARRGGEGRVFVLWQLLGILDLIVAVGAGASLRSFSDQADLTSASQMVRLSELPLALIPAFAVPLFVILHLATLAQHRARTRGVEEQVY